MSIYESWYDHPVKNNYMRVGHNLQLLTLAFGSYVSPKGIFIWHKNYFEQSHYRKISIGYTWEKEGMEEMLPSNHYWLIR